MKKYVTATEASRMGQTLGNSCDANYLCDDDDFDDLISERSRRQYRNFNKPKKNQKNKSKGQKTCKKKANGNDDDTSSIASSSSLTSTPENTTKKSVRPRSTGKSKHQQKAVDLSHLNHITEDLEIEFANNVKESSILSSVLPADVLKLERQLSGSGDYVECLDLSYSNYDWKNYPYHINKMIGKVNLSHNNLRNIPLNFLQFPKLSVVSFSSNLLRDIDMPLRMDFLVVLELQFNKISHFPSPEILENLPALKKLIMFCNLIEEIPKESVLKLASRGVIEEINLSHNELRFLPNEIGKLTSLTALRLSSNKIQTLPMSITELSIADSNFSIFGNSLSHPPQVQQNYKQICSSQPFL